MSAIFKHELKSYFRSMSAYLFGTFLLVFVGIGMMLINIFSTYSNFEYVLLFVTSPSSAGSLLTAVPTVFVLIVPILTMRVIAEERKQKTDQLLYSLPVSSGQVVIGKYLALMVVYAVPLAIMCIYPLILSRFGEVYLPTAYASLIAFFLMGAALIAIGEFISSLTENQGIAAGICVAVVLLSYYSVTFSEYITSTAVGSAIALCIFAFLLGVIIWVVTKNDNLAYFTALALIALIVVLYFVNPTMYEGLLPNILQNLSVYERFETMVYGKFDLTSIVYFASVVVLFLFLSVQSLEKRRYN